MKIPEQIQRLGMLLAGVLAVVLLLRFVVLPEDMFSAKPHQAAKALREMDNPLHHAGMLSLMWLTAMERYLQHCDAGMEMLAIRYASWLTAPRQTAAAMLDYCRCRPAEMAAVYAALERDSQADTHLSRAALQQQHRTIADHEFDQLHFHLERHPFIHDPDYELPNTLKL